jgi:hypothetical protein
MGPIDTESANPKAMPSSMSIGFLFFASGRQLIVVYPNVACVSANISLTPFMSGAWAYTRRTGSVPEGRIITHSESEK